MQVNFAEAQTFGAKNFVDSFSQRQCQTMTKEETTKRRWVDISSPNSKMPIDEVSSMQKLDVIATEEIATVEKTVVTEEIVIVHPRAVFLLTIMY